MSTAIELSGLELHGHHGVGEEERRAGQRFLFDVRLEVAEGTGASDRIEDTVDYREVVTVVQEVSEARSFHLLEALAATLADTLLARFPVEAAHVRVRKPDVRLTAPVEHAAAAVTRRR